MKQTVTLASALFIFCAGITAQAQTKTGIHLLHTHKIQGDGSWDYLLADQGKLYVSHSTEVNILDQISGDPTGLITNTPGVHGIALVHSLKKGYISDGKSDDCTVFNTSDNTVLKKIKTGEKPDAIFYDDFSKKVFVFNGRSSDVSVINPQTDEVIKTIPLGGKPETGVSDGKGNIYVNLEDKNEVVCFDALSFKIKHRFPAKGGEEPSGLAIDSINNRLFVGCGNKKLIVLSALTGKIISTLPIGDGSDGVAFDTTLKLIYSSNREGTLTVIKEIGANQFKVLENIKTAYGARTLAVDQYTHHIFLPTSDFKANDKKTIIPGTFRVMEFGK